MILLFKLKYFDLNLCYSRLSTTVQSVSQNWISERRKGKIIERGNGKGGKREREGKGEGKGRGKKGERDRRT